MWYNFKKGFEWRSDAAIFKNNFIMVVRSFIIGTAVSVFLLFSITYFAVAFTNPTLPPTGGTGAISYTSGNVGIGITTATDPLEVSYSNGAFGTGVPGIAINTTAGSGQAVLGFRTSGNLQGRIRSDTAGNIVVAAGTGGGVFLAAPEGAWGVYVQPVNANVGIGNIAPGAYKLNVSGNTNVTGNLNFTGSLLQNGVPFNPQSTQWTQATNLLYPSSTANKVAIGNTGGFGAALTVGDTAVNYAPNSAQWQATWASNILLNGLDSTSISFNDFGQGVATIRYTNRNFYLGEDVGWGTSTVNVAGPIILGKYSADPTGSAGMMYYNTASSSFRCYTTSWSNCGGGAVYQ